MVLLAYRLLLWLASEHIILVGLWRRELPVSPVVVVVMGLGLARESYILPSVILRLLFVLLLWPPVGLLLVTLRRVWVLLGSAVVIHILNLPTVHPVLGLVLSGRCLGLFALGWAALGLGRHQAVLALEPVGYSLHQGLGVVYGHPVTIVEGNVQETTLS